MTGIYGAGVGVGLERLGFTDCFDFVIGVSAGAANAAYFLSRQGELGETIYHQDLTDRRWVNPFRLKMPVDLDYLELVFRNIKKLDVEAIRNSRSQFFVSATDIDTGRGRLIDAKPSEIDMIIVIKASMAMPIVYNKPVAVDGKKYADGMTSLPIPISYVLDQLGCTDVLVVMNKPYGYMAKSRLPLHERALVKIKMRGNSPEYLEAISSKYARLNTELVKLWGLERRNIRANLGVLAPNSLPIHLLSQNPQLLRSVSLKATAQTMTMFGQ